MLPRTHGAAPEVVFLNTAGGLTGGDRLNFTLDVEPGADVLGTTQTAERAYASATGRAHLDVSLSVGSGGRLDWIPQETILFDRAALDRVTRVDLARDARILMAETIVLGRIAMDERLRQLDFTDRRLVYRDGTPVWLDPFGLNTASLGASQQPARLANAVAISTLALIAPDAADRLASFRQALVNASDDGVTLAASAWDGRLILRAHAPQAYPLRRWVARAITQLSDRPLPRVWQI